MTGRHKTVYHPAFSFTYIIYHNMTEEDNKWLRREHSEHMDRSNMKAHIQEVYSRVRLQPYNQTKYHDDQ